MLKTTTSPTLHGLLNIKPEAAPNSCTFSWYWYYCVVSSRDSLINLYKKRMSSFTGDRQLVRQPIITVDRTISRLVRHDDLLVYWTVFV